MENRSFYNEILTEHNVRPEFKHDLPDADIVLEGVNPSCGDDIFLKLKVEDDTICGRSVCGRWMCDLAGFCGYHAGNGYRQEERGCLTAWENLYEDD